MRNELFERIRAAREALAADDAVRAGVIRAAEEQQRARESQEGQEFLNAKKDQFAKLITLQGLGIFDIIAKKTRTKPYQPQEPQLPLSEEERKRLSVESSERMVAAGTAIKMGENAYWMPAPKDAQFPDLSAPSWRVSLKEPRKVDGQWDTTVDIKVTHSRMGSGRFEKKGRFDVARVSVSFDGDRLSISGNETVFSGQVPQLEGDGGIQSLHTAFDKAFDDPAKMPIPKPTPPPDYARVRNARYRGLQ